MSFGDRGGDVRPDVDDYRVITTGGEIRRGAQHGCQARMESGFYEDGAGDAVAVAESIYRTKTLGRWGGRGGSLRMRQIDRCSV